MKPTIQSNRPQHQDDLGEFLESVKDYLAFFFAIYGLMWLISFFYWVIAS